MLVAERHTMLTLSSSESLFLAVNLSADEQVGCGSFDDSDWGAMLVLEVESSESCPSSHIEGFSSSQVLATDDVGFLWCFACGWWDGCHWREFTKWPRARRIARVARLRPSCWRAAVRGSESSHSSEVWEIEAIGITFEERYIITE